MTKLNPSDPVVQWASFGRQAELWAESDVGQFVLKHLEEERDEALLKLKTADPTDANVIRSLQNTVKVCEYLPDRLAELIRAGHQAIEELKNATT